MLSLFLNDTTINYRQLKDPTMDYIRRHVIMELTNVKSYYREAAGVVDNSHILVRLLKNLSIDYNAPLMDQFISLDGEAIYQARNIGIVSNINKGDVIRDGLLGANSMEVFIYAENDIDILSISENWRDMRPLRAIYIPTTDMHFKRPDETLSFDDLSLSIFSIDPKMMALQYRFWALERLSLGYGTDPASFVYQYILTNTMDDIVDIAFFNAYMTIMGGLEPNYGKNTHPFSVRDMTTRINTVAKMMSTKLIGSASRYEELIGNMPLISKESLKEQMVMLSISPNTQQGKWATWVASVPYINALFSISDERTITNNKDLIGELRMYKKLLDRSRSLDQHSDVYNDIMYKMSLAMIESYL